MKFSIGNETFILSVLQYLLIVNSKNGYVCYTVFQGVNLKDAKGSFIWILGNYFLSRFYSIYDVRFNRIGLAKSISYDSFRPLPEPLFNNSSQRSIFVLIVLINYLLILFLS